MKYTLTLEMECPKNIGDSLYIFKDGDSLNYKEYIISNIKFDRWNSSREGQFEYHVIGTDNVFYSDKFFINLENEEYYNKIWNGKYILPSGEIGGHNSYFKYFYTKEGAELQKKGRIKFKIEQLKEKKDNILKEINEFLENEDIDEDFKLLLN